MKLNHAVASALIMSTTLVALSACDSDDDGGSDNSTDTATPVTFDEAIDGDISNEPGTPLSLQLANGDNRISGTVITSPDTGTDLDYVSINVPEGSVLNSLILEAYTSVDDVSFIGIQEGPTFTLLSADAPENQNQLLGWSHLGSSVGVDILGTIGSPPGAGDADTAQGFTPPLTAGDYTFWIQETGPEQVDYTLNMVVSAQN